MSILTFLDYAGVALFAATGGLAASRKQLDFVGFLFFAATTGIGGGTLRDLVLGGGPVFWVKDPTYLIICFVVGIFVFFTAIVSNGDTASSSGSMQWGLRLLCHGRRQGPGSHGLTHDCHRYRHHDGCLRRHPARPIANEPSILLRPEIYVTAAMAGAAVFTGATLGELPLWLSSSLGMAAAFGLRGGAIHYGWMLPRFHSRPGRPTEEAIKGKTRRKG